MEKEEDESERRAIEDGDVSGDDRGRGARLRPGLVKRQSHPCGNQCNVNRSLRMNPHY